MGRHGDKFGSEEPPEEVQVGSSHLDEKNLENEAVAS